MTSRSDLLDADESARRTRELIKLSFERADWRISTQGPLQQRRYFVHRSVDEICQLYLDLNKERNADKMLNVEEVLSHPSETCLEITMQEYESAMTCIGKMHVVLCGHEFGTQIVVSPLRPSHLTQERIAFGSGIFDCLIVLWLLPISNEMFRYASLGLVFGAVVIAVMLSWTRRGWKKNVLQILDWVESEIRPYEIDQLSLSPMRRPALAVGGSSDFLNKGRSRGESLVVDQGR